MSENHKEHKEHKKSNNFLKIAIAIIAVAALAFVFMRFLSVPTAAITGAVQTQDTKTPLNNFTVSGDTIVSKQITQSLPYHESMSLAAGKYSVDVSTNSKARISIFTEAQYQSWSNDNWPTPKLSSGCCSESLMTTQFNGNFDVNKGEQGNYYLIVEGNGQTSINFNVIQLTKY